MPVAAAGATAAEAAQVVPMKRRRSAGTAWVGSHQFFAVPCTESSGADSRRAPMPARTVDERMTRDASFPMRYDLNLWIGHPFECATYLPR